MVCAVIFCLRVNTMQKYLFQVNIHNMCICCISLWRFLPLSVIALIPRYYIFLGNISRACVAALSLCVPIVPGCGLILHLLRPGSSANGGNSPGSFARACSC